MIKLNEKERKLQYLVQENQMLRTKLKELKSMQARL